MSDDSHFMSKNIYNVLQTLTDEDTKDKIFFPKQAGRLSNKKKNSSLQKVV